jgi:hypothetical protein
VLRTEVLSTGVYAAYALTRLCSLTIRDRAHLGGSRSSFTLTVCAMFSRHALKAARAHRMAARNGGLAELLRWTLTG